MQKIIELKLKDLKKAVWNYKLDDDEKRSKLTANLKRNGQVENLVVRPLGNKYEVINGNHRLDSMNDAGFKTALCFNVGDISKAAAVRLAIELNETRFDTSPVKLAESLQGILKEFSIEDISSTMPYSKENIEETISMLNMDWAQFEQHEGADGKKEFISISEFFAKLGIPGIPKDLADKLEPVLQQIIDREGLTRKNAFMIFDAILAALINDGEGREAVQTEHKKKK